MRTSIIDNEHARSAGRACTFSQLGHGGALLRCGTVSKTLDGKDAAEFFAKIRDKGQGYIKRVVRSYFADPQV